LTTLRLNLETQFCGSEMGGIWLVVFVQRVREPRSAYTESPVGEIDAKFIDVRKFCGY